jgi:site-specific DNA recombinase
VYDQRARRYTPSHSVKNAKRYRYYVMPSARRQEICVIPARIPADDLEALVVQRLLRWLSDKLAVLDALSTSGDDTAVAQALLAAATAHCRAWPTRSAEQVRDVVRAVVAKITIGVECIAIQLSKSALRALLLPAAAANHIAQEPEDDLIELNIEARLKRCGRAVRLIVTSAETGPAESNDQQHLIHTLAQAQLWFAQLQGNLTSVSLGTDGGRHHLACRYPP